MKINYEHRQSAHCENGVISGLLHFHHIEISEPMAFGIGSGLFFSHFPFLKLNNIPVTSYRILPGHIFKRVTKRLGIKVAVKTFKNKDESMDALDKMLESGTPVGLLTSVFYLPYLPKAFRFHFNAHNIVVFGKENGHYLVSDPVMDEPTEITYEDLRRARFPKGLPEPKGRMYYPVKVPEKIDFRKPIIDGIRKTAKDMATIPIPLFGVKSIRLLARRIKKYPSGLGEEKAILYLGNVIRMQEEIGTGGAGFRFIFAAFLQEAAQKISMPVLSEMSREMTETGNRWRDFAFQAGRVCKGREASPDSYNQLAEILFECADREEAIFRKLMKIS